jgi:hypothetical protein
MTTPEAPQRETQRKPLNPYVVTALLFGLAGWFLYDGFLNPEIRSVWFNRIGGLVFLFVGIWDGLRQRRMQRARAAQLEGADLRAPSGER